MAVTTTAIPAADLAARAADCPLLIARSNLEIAYKQAVAQLVTNKTGTLGAGDLSATGFDRRKLTQRFKHLLWKGNSSGTAWYVVIDVGTDEQDVDALVVGPGHNLSGVNCTVKADGVAPVDAAWAGSTDVFASAALAAGTNIRLHAASSIRARYWRIDLTSGGAFTPEATSFWLGKAVQFPTLPLFSSATPNSYRGSAEEVQTKGGIPYRYVHHGALVERDLSWVVDENHAGTFFGTNLQDLFTNANALSGGHANFWYVDQPTTAPNSGILVRLDDPTYRPVLRRGGAGSAGATRFSMSIKEVGS